jgi:hypothetical protein
MLPAPAPVRLPPPPAAIAAAVLGCLGAIGPGLLVLIVIALYEGEDGVQKWLWPLVPGAFSAGLVTGAVLLLLGRSWLALVVPAAAMTALGAALWLSNGAALRLVAVLPILLPLAAAVLGAQPAVRTWVRDRRAA